jgi:uncharacterized membrane protein SirB2
MIFTLAKYTHLIAISLSVIGFIIRSYMLVNGQFFSSDLQQPLSKRKQFLQKKVPQYIDIILLASATVMLWQWQWVINPISTPWLSEKLVILCCYILLGMVALHWGKTFKVRLVASVLAVLCFIYIVYVALTKTTLIF